MEQTPCPSYVSIQQFSLPTEPEWGRFKNTWISRGQEVSRAPLSYEPRPTQGYVGGRQPYATDDAIDGGMILNGSASLYDAAGRWTESCDDCCCSETDRAAASRNSHRYEFLFMT